MNRLLICIVLMISIQTASAIDYTNAPAYVAGDFYVFKDEATALTALQTINATGFFPDPSSNNKGVAGTPAVRWTDAVITIADDKFVFARIPDALLDSLNVPVATRRAWWDAFKPDIEQASADWFADNN